jgi:NAD-dependent deacetylase
MAKPILVTFSGAGLSKESGIATFRDCVDGLWHNYKIEEVASQAGWINNPQTVLSFYQARTLNVRAAAPNAAHYAIAKLQAQFRVVNITQNIDDLLERAGCEEVWHLHGDVNHRKCERHKSIAVMENDMHFTCDHRESQVSPVSFGERCIKCGGQMRPDVVWFGEAVDMRYDEIESLMRKASVFIGVGTSAIVYPAAGLLQLFADVNVKYFVDPTPPARLGDYHVIADAACAAIPKIVDELLKAS